MILRLSPKTEERLRMLAKFHETKPHSLAIDIIEMYLMDHVEALARAEHWVKEPETR